MIVTFSETETDGCGSQGEPVETVEEYKYLGTIFDNLLKFFSNKEEILKKCHQRQYLLRKLKSHGTNDAILTTIYYAFIENVFTFSFTCWFYNITLQNRNILLNIVKVCSKINH